MVEAADFGDVGDLGGLARGCGSSLAAHGAKARRSGGIRPGGLVRTVTALVLSASVTLGGGAVAVAQVPAGEVPPPAMPATPSTPPPPAVAVPAPEAVPSVPPPPPWAQVPPPMAYPGVEMAAAPPSRLPAILLWAVGGASLAVGAAFGIAAISAKNDFDSKPTYALADKVHDRAVISDVGFGLGLVLIATGTVFYFSGAGSAAEPRVAAATTGAGGIESKGTRLGFAPMIGSTSGGGVVTMRF